MKSSLPKNSVINSRNFKKVSKLLNRYEHGNCWGTTLFLIGEQKRRHAIHGTEMNDFLKAKTRVVKKCKVGDILVLRYSSKRAAKRVEEDQYHLTLKADLLSHTALCIGKDRYIHQAGYNGPIREHNLKQILAIYEYYSATTIEIARVKKPKKKITKRKTKK